MVVKRVPSFAVAEIVFIMGIDYRVVGDLSRVNCYIPPH
jgi:hypothetical protein